MVRAARRAARLDGAARRSASASPRRAAASAARAGASSVDTWEITLMVAAGAVVILAELCATALYYATRDVALRRPGADRSAALLRRRVVARERPLPGDHPAQRHRRRRPRAVPPVMRRAVAPPARARGGADGLRAAAAGRRHGRSTAGRALRRELRDVPRRARAGSAAAGHPGRGRRRRHGAVAARRRRAAADFYLRTGYMPLGAPGRAAVRAARVLFSERRDPRARRATSRRSARARRSRSRIPSAGASPRGCELFTEHCAGCHQIVARGRRT